MQRNLLIFCGIITFCFFNYGFFQWIHSGHGMAEVLRALKNDWLVLITFVDACLFTLLVFNWLIKDLARQGYRFNKKIFVFLAVLITGTSAFFIYLAFRSSLKNRIS